MKYLFLSNLLCMLSFFAYSQSNFAEQKKAELRERAKKQIEQRQIKYEEDRQKRAKAYAEKLAASVKAKISISGAKGPKGGYRGDISFSARPTDKEIAALIKAYRWDFSDGKSYDVDYIARGFENPGKYFVRLTIVKFDGSSESSNIGFTVEQSIDPTTIRSNKRIETLSPKLTNLASGMQLFRWKIHKGAFHPKHEMIVQVNDQVVDKSHIKVMAADTLETNVLLKPGKNSLELIGFDNDEYEIRYEEIVIAGSNSVIIDFDKNPPDDLSKVTVHLVEMGDITKQETKSVISENGTVRFEIPHVECFVTVFASNFYASGFFKPGQNSLKLYTLDLDSSLSSSHNFDLSQGLQYWDVIEPKDDTGITKLSELIKLKKNIRIRRAVRAPQDTFISFPVSLNSNGNDLKVHLSITNINNGKRDVLSKDTEMLYDEGIKLDNHQLNVFVSGGEIAVIDLNFIQK